MTAPSALSAEEEAALRDPIYIEKVIGYRADDPSQANALVPRLLATLDSERHANRTAPGKTLKPDGWHTYHICGGVLRELTMLRRDGTVSEATCENCGEWYRGVATQPSATP